MADDRPEVSCHGKAVMIRTKFKPCPPGTKAQRLREYEPPSPWPWRLLTAGVALAALAVGVLIGRFLH